MVTVKKVPPRSLAIFTRQLSVMVDAGLPIVQCLELLAREEPDLRLAKAVDLVRADIEAGLSLAEALDAAAKRSIRSTRTWWRRARRAASSM